VTKRLPKALSVLLIGISLMLGEVTRAFAGEQVVLIVSASSTVERLDSSAVRRLFLGLTVEQDGNRLRPVLNESDPQLKDIFLQNVVSMSESSYDRRVLQLSLTQGRKQPLVYRSYAQLASGVAADPEAVSYAWARDVAHDPRVRVLRVLWHD
jgi:hypothetical protein